MADNELGGDPRDPSAPQVDWEAMYRQSQESVGLLEEQLRAVRTMWYWPLAAPARRLWRARFRRNL